jgi:hypothetical protein
VALNILELFMGMALHDLQDIKRSKEAKDAESDGETEAMGSSNVSRLQPSEEASVRRG